MVRIRLSANVHHLVGDDVIGVLSPCQELDSLCVAVGDELQLVFHHERRVQIVRVDGDAQEGEEAVLGRDDLVVNLGGTLTVKVEAERRAVALDEAYRADLQVVAMAVVNHQFVGGRTQRSENGVEQDGVRRKLQLQVGIGIDLVVFLARNSNQG